MQLRTGEAAQRLGVSSERVRQLAASGELRANRTALGRLFDQADVDALAIARRRRRGQEEHDGDHT